ncbi:MAG: SEC-C metal-binding domain-containing protein [Candidatus Cloacimonadales bacterium]|nr:SEC-C metal-binding domain-containing protein [Candidatus Cloacimonadales bacterium]
MAKVGRNDPCPCGSGKKYKKCCLNKQRDISDEFLWQQSRQIDEKLIDKLARFAKQQFGFDVLHIAWKSFSGSKVRTSFESNPHIQIFLPWFLYNWLPAFSIDINIPASKMDFTIAEFYLDKYAIRLSPLEREYILQACKQPYSYYEVTDIQVDYGMTLKNMLWDETVLVREKSGTHYLSDGSIIFGRIINFEGLNLMLGCSSIQIPSKEKINIINFKEIILKDLKKINRQNIAKWQNWLFGSYLHLYEKISTPPKFVNKEGNDLVFSDIKYEITDPELVWNLLKDLDEPWTDEEYRDIAEFDENNKLYKIEFPWLSPLMQGEINRSVYAHITICGNELTVAVNSRKREKAAKAKMNKLLSGNAKYKNTIMKTLDQIMNDPTIKAKPDETERILEESPETHQMMENYFKNHWNNWIANKIPILGNITPKQAVKTALGKEKVIALLDDFEHSERKHPQQIDQLKFIMEVRKKLGLA